MNAPSRMTGLILATLTAFNSSPLLAQENKKRMSQDQEINEIVVTGTRNETDVRHLSQTVSVVSRQQIEDAMQPSLLPVLSQQVPGQAANDLAKEIADLPIRVSWGEAGLIEAAQIPKADCVITAVVGMVGLKPTLAAIRAKKRIGPVLPSPPFSTALCGGQIRLEKQQLAPGNIYQVLFTDICGILCHSSCRRCIPGICGP